MGTLSITNEQITINKRGFGLPALLFVGVFLRLWQMTGELWYDEAFTAYLTRLSIPDLVAATTYDVHPPTYYLLMKAVTLLGHSEFVLRLPSLIAGCILIWLVYRLARTLELSPAGTWIATGLTALSPFQIYYSDEARFYALQTMFIAAAALGLFERRQWLFIGASLAALYLHHISIIFVACLYVTGLVCHRNWSKEYFITGAIIFLGWLPMAGLAITQAQAIHHNYWIPPLSSPGRLISIIDDLIFLVPGNTFVIASALASCIGLLMIVTSVPQVLTSISYTPLYLFPMTFLPLVMATIISLFWQPILIGRVMAPMAPFYYLLLAWSVTVTDRRVTVWLSVVTPVLIAILAGVIWGKFGHKPLDTDYLTLYGHYKPLDGVFHASVGSFMDWAYYRPDVPQFVLQQPGELDQTLTIETKLAMHIPQARFEDIACERPRWWLIQFNNPTSSKAEIAYIDDLTRRYEAKKIAVLRQDVAVDAWLYLIQSQSYCERSQSTNGKNN